MDKCLFIKKDMICGIYVYGTILAGLEAKELEEIIKSLSIAEEE